MSETLTEAETMSLAALKVQEQAGLLTDTSERLRYKALRSVPPAPLRELSPGAQVVTGHPYRDLAVKALKANRHGNALPITEDVPLGNFGPTGTKTLLRAGSATSVGAFQFLGVGDYAPARRPLDLLDLVRLGTTDEAAIQYMRQTTYTPAAVEVGEASSTTTGTKPESSLPFEQVLSPIESIASWVPVTTRSLADVDELKGLIDDQLLFDARRRLEAQILAGNGTSPNLRGIDNTTGVLTQPKGADSVPLALAKGIAQVVAAGYTPTGVALHPDDWTDAATVILANGGSLARRPARSAGRQERIGCGRHRLRGSLEPSGGLDPLDRRVRESHTLHVPDVQPRRGPGRDSGSGRCARTRLHLPRHRYLMAGMDLLERLRGTSYREHIEVLEHEPPSQLVASTDILRSDQLGRSMVACPAGQVPPRWLTLTTEERDGLVEAKPPPPQGHLHRVGFGFAPESKVIGEYVTDNNVA